LSRTSAHPIILILCLFFPGIFENFFFGQNGFLSGALLGGGLLLLDGWPILAGCLIGLLSYKPTLLILALAALIFGRYWKTLISALACALILALASALVFGVQVWTAYWETMSVPMRQLEVGMAIWSIMPTFFAATLSAGFGVMAAYLVQGVAMLLAVAGVAWVWRRHTGSALCGSVLVLGTFLFTPYAQIYDLALLALPLCWLWEEGRIHGRLPGELLLLFIGWLMPLAEQVVWSRTNIFDGKLQIAPVIILALFFLSLVKVKQAMGRDPVNL
jgi:alpha-1,2-mannosyltransferase